MRFFLLSILLMFLGLTFTSCITSLRELQTSENIITNDRITGLWAGSGRQIRVEKLTDNKDYKDIFKDARAGNTPIAEKDSMFYLKHYIITSVQENLKYTWAAALISIGNSVFVNLSDGKCTDKNDKDAYQGGGNILSGSFIAKFEWKNQNTIQLQFINGEYIKQIILAGKIRIKHEYDPLFGTFIITASAKELEQFLEKYGNEEWLYKGGNTIMLERKN